MSVVGGFPAAFVWSCLWSSLSDVWSLWSLWSPLWSLWSVLVLLGWVPVQPWTHEVLEAVSGQDVTLRCSGPVRSELELLWWIRLDLINEGDVFFYRENRSYQDYQVEQFRGRVFLRAAPGPDVSIVLKEVTPDDTGTYECRTVGSSDPDRDRNEPDEFYQTQARTRLLVRGLHEVHADPGQDLVLPCSGPKRDQILLLQWSRPDRAGFIYVHESGKPDQIPLQDHRVHLRDPQLSGGDASLVLKDVRLQDAGTFVCFILFTRPGLNQDQTRTKPGLQPLEKTHTIITLTVSGPEGEEQVRPQSLAVRVLVIVLVLGLCGALLFMLHRRTTDVPPHAGLHI